MSETKKTKSTKKTVKKVEKPAETPEVAEVSKASEPAKGTKKLLKDNPRGEYFINQYTPPFCYELAGRTFVCAMDDGLDYTLRFIDKDTVEWNFENTEPKKDKYQCLKGDDTTYLVSYELEGTAQRTNHTFVIDLENQLVTRIIARIGDNPKYPYITNSFFEFGAIRQEDGSIAFKRHSYTDEMVGTVMQWCYGQKMTTVHVYYCTNFYRITYPRNRVQNEKDRERNDEMTAMVNSLPSSDEPATYIKIKNNMYLLNITEKNMEKLIGGKVPFRSNAMCFLQNYDHMYQVGRSFGTSTYPTGDVPTNIMFGAVGQFTEVEQEFIDFPNPFIT